MKKNYFFTAVYGFLFTSILAQFTKDEVQYWVGSGTDSAVVVIDFNDNTNSPSLAWGFLFEAGTNITISTLLATMDNEITDFSVNQGLFLNDINYDVHSGVGGTNNYYWGTYTGTSMNDLMLNGGINDVLMNGNWYGFNFTDWDSNPLQDLSNPAAAINPSASINELSRENVEIYQDKNYVLINGLVGNLKVLDLTGKVIVEMLHHTQTSIANSTFNSGLYLVSIQTNTGLVSRKVQF